MQPRARKAALTKDRRRQGAEGASSRVGGAVGGEGEGDGYRRRPMNGWAHTWPGHASLVTVGSGVGPSPGLASGGVGVECGRPRRLRTQLLVLVPVSPLLPLVPLLLSWSKRLSQLH